MATTDISKASGYTWMRNWLPLVAILVFAATIRLYKIKDYMTFLGDEGRDVLVVKHLLEGDLVGLGPTASVGGFFTGPIYYYLMAPFLWLFGYDPVGPAIMVALFGIATVFLTYWVGKKFFDVRAGLFAAALYAVSPLIIAYSRSSWNPNLLPFFSLLTIFFLYEAVKRKTFKYFIITGLLLGIGLQLHYITVFLGVAVASFVIFTGLPKVTLVAKHLSTILLGFLAGISPFLAFEATHGFPNMTTVIKFAFGATGETGFAGEKFGEVLGNVFFRLFGRLLMRFPSVEQVDLAKDIFTISLYGPPLSFPIVYLYIATLVVAFASIALLFYQGSKAWKKKDAFFQKALVLSLWLIIGISLFGFYKKPIYDYYFGFMYPLPFLLIGNLLSTIYRKMRYGKACAVFLFAAIFLLNFDGVPQRFIPNRQLAQVRGISEFVLEKTDGKPFNFALITLGNSDHAYRYFFEVEGNAPITIESFEKDPERQTVTDQLLIICEDPNCEPLGNPLWEVSGFGRAEIVGEWKVAVVKVFKLVPYKGPQ